MKKKLVILSGIIIVIGILFLATQSPFVDEIILRRSEVENRNSFTSIEGFQYEINDDGSVTITGYEGENNVDLIVPETITDSSGTVYNVTGIGDNAFLNIETIQSITVGKNITTIGSSIIDEGVLIRVPTTGKIVIYAKENGYRSVNTSYTSIDSVGWSFDIENKVLTIEKNGYTTFDSPSAAPWYDFRKCIMKVEYLESEDTVLQFSFYEYPNLQEVNLSNVGLVANYAFNGCDNLTTVRGLSNEAVIGIQSFYECTKLTDIDLSNVTFIGMNAFGDCSSLTNVTSTSKLETIYGSAFQGCSSLKGPIDLSNVKRYGSDYSYNTTSDLVFQDCESLERVILSNAITYVPVGMFRGCSSLTTVGDLSNVTSIGSSAFSGCSSLTAVGDLSNVTSIGGSAFSGCSSLTSVEIPSGVTIIENNTFNGCSSLTEVDLSNITSIGGSAFSGCSSLTAVGDLSSVTSIGSNAFYGCSSLTAVGDLSSVTSIGGNTFRGCSNLTTVGDLSSVTSIGSNAFYGCSSLTTVGDLSSVTSIKDYAFYGCSKLTGPIDLSNVTTIDQKAFQECSNLTGPIDLSNVTNIGNDAFRECSNLTTVGDLSNVTSIGNWAFDGCSNLTGTINLSNVTSVGTRAFYKCESLEKVKILVNDANSEEKIEWGSIVFAETPVTMQVRLGSSAQTYAESNDINYEILDVAKIEKDGATYSYLTLAEAIEAVEDNTETTITLLKKKAVTDGTEQESAIEITEDLSIGESQNIILNLSENTINGNITNNGTLKLTNGNINGTVTNAGNLTVGDNIEDKITITSETYALENTGTVAINGGTLKGKTNAINSTGTLNILEGYELIVNNDTEYEVATLEQSENSNNNTFTYVDNGDGTITITGYTGENPDLVIPNEITVDDVIYQVTGIADNAFKENEIVQTITINENVTSIGKEIIDYGVLIYGEGTNITAYAEENGYKIIEPDTTTISGEYWNFDLATKTLNITDDASLYESNETPLYGGYGAPWQSFKKSINKVVLVDTITKIYDSSFFGCINLTEINLAKVTSIGDSAFYECSILTEVGNLSNVISIGNAAFYECNSLTKIDLLKVTSIGDSAFYGCSILTEIGNLSSVVSIGNSAFRGCALTTVENLSSATSIGDSAFSGCSYLTIVGDLSSVTSIGNSAFSGCSSLTTVGDSSNVTSIGNSAFEGCGKLTEVENLSSVTRIGNMAFCRCNNLTSVGTLSSVASIGNSAFNGCTKLANVGDLSKLTSMGQSAFWGCNSLTGTLNFQLLTNVNDWAFVGCTNLTTVNFSGVTRIGNSAFDGCSNLKTIGGLSNVTSIGSYAFMGCKNLTGTLELPHVIDIQSSAFSGCSSLTTVEKLSNVTSIGDSAFSGCSSLITVGDLVNVKSIGRWAFSGCSKLKTAKILVNDANLDKKTEWGESIFLDAPVTMLVRLGSSAQVYAVANNINYEILDVAKIEQGEKTFGYLTLAEAIEAVQDNTETTITLLKKKTVTDGTEQENAIEITENLNIGESKNIILNLSENTINGNITNNGTLKLTNGNINGTVTNTGNLTVGDNIEDKITITGETYALENTGTATMNGGTLKGKTNAINNTGTLNKPESYEIVTEKDMETGYEVATLEKNGVSYKIEHYQENVDGTYSLKETEEKTGTTGEEVTAVYKDYEGFKENPEHEEKIVSGEVVEDGSLVLKLYYLRNSYRLVINKGENITEVTGAGTYKHGQEVEIVATVNSQAGYEYKNFRWETEKAEVIENVVEKTTKVTMPIGDVEVTAKTDKNAIKYTITYELNGGNLSEGESNPLEYTVETETITLKNPTKQGYTFKGWYENSDFNGNEVTIIEQGSTGEKTFYAKWEANTDTVYKVEHYQENIDGTYTLEETEEKTGTTGASITPETKTYEGFTSPEKQTKEILADGSTVIKYNYTRNSYSITVTKGNGIENVTVNERYKYEQEVKLEATLKEGYENIVWTGEYETATFNMPAKDIEMSVNASAIKYTIIYELNGGSLAEGETNPVEFTVETETITLSNPEKEGYTFLGWYENSDFSGDSVITIEQGSTGDKAYYAKWRANTDVQYKVEHYKETLEGTYELVEGDTETLYGTVGASITPETNTYEGFTSPEKQTKEILTDGSTVIKYNYTRNSYSITVTKGKGIENVTANQTYKYEQEVKLEATLKEGYENIVWTGEYETATFNMPAKNIEMTVNANVIKYTITYELNGGNLAEGESNPLEYTVETETITLKNPTKQGYTFKGWYENSDFSGDEVTTIEQGRTGEKTFYAKWIANTDIVYKVEHYQENVDGTYTLKDTEEKKGTTGEEVTGVYKTYEGFKENAIHEDAIVSGQVVEDGSLVLKLYYLRNSYRLIINKGNNITEVTGAGTYKHGQEVEIVATVNSQAGYEYKNFRWETEKAEVIENVAEKATKVIMPIGDVEVTAKADKKAIKYTIAYELNGGSLAEGERNPVEYTVETETITLKNPERQGYTFAGWYENSDYSGNAVTKIEKGSTGNKIFYAKWEANTDTVYKVKHYLEKLNGEYELEETEEKKGTTGEQVIGVANEYQGFKEDTENENRKVKGQIKGDGSLVLKLYYKRAEYDLTVEKGNNIEEVTGTGKYKYGQEVEIVAKVENQEGYSYTNFRWETQEENLIENKTQKKIKITIPAKNVTIRAEVEKRAIEYSITYNLDGGSLEGTNPVTYTIETDDITIKNPSKQGYTFKGWILTKLNGEPQEGKEPNSNLIIEKGSMGDREYTAIWESDEIKVNSNKYTLIKDNNINYIEGIIVNTKVGEIKKELIESGTNGKMSIWNGETELADDSIVATGMDLVIKLNNEEISYKVVVKGDITGDGQVNNTDLLMLARYIVGFEYERGLVVNEKLRATDVLSDNKLGTSIDLLKLARVLVSLDNF